MLIYDLTDIPADVRDQIHNSPKYTKWFSEKPSRLLGIASDAKTIKGLKYEVLTGILYLIPSDGSGFNLCPMATIAKCKGPCLNTAGRGAMGSVQMSRLRKTLFYLQYPEEFEALLIKDIRRVVRMALRKHFVPAIRLNGTSDIRWEREFPGIFELFSDVSFYDYTKLYNRNVHNIPNYDLTFSYSGVPAFLPYVDKAIAKGMRMAVVFKHKDKIPNTFVGMTCVDGDDSDIRFNDPHGVVVALYAKGKARHDTSGFVVDNFLF